MKDVSPLAITSAVVGFPARVCVITLKDGTVHRFAESDEAVVVGSDTFSVVPGLSISAVKHTANGEVPSCQITAVHVTSGIFKTDELDIGLFDGATVQIYTVDRLNLTRKGLLFTGEIAQISYSIENQAIFDVKGPGTSARILMTQKRSPMCRTDWGSGLCQKDRTAYAVTAIVATIPTAYTFTVTGSLAQASGYFDQGTITGKPFVIFNWNQSTQTITTSGPCDRLLSVGESITLYPGCDKTDDVGGCGKFSNWENFQGENHWRGTAASAQQV